MPYVGVGRRSLAFLVDLVLSIVWTAPFTEVVRTPGHVEYRLMNGRFVAVMLIWFAYHVTMETSFGGTVGKLVTGIRVIGPGGSHPDLTTSLKRTAARPVDAFPYVIPYLVGAIAVWRSPTRQRLGDRWSGTHVARAGLHLPLETPRPDPWMPGFARIPFGQKAPPFPPPPPMPPPSDPGPMGGAG